VGAVVVVVVVVRRYLYTVNSCGIQRDGAEEQEEMK
jgi:hypothetical protein